MSQPSTIVFNITGDIVVGLTVVWTWMGYLPDIAAGMAIIYYTILAYSAWSRRRKD